MDLSIEGRIYRNNTYENATIGITNGTITAIKKTLKTDTHKTYTPHLILPAGIDLHVHFRDPGAPHKETFQTGSTAAAYGGITTIFDMPNTTPPTTTIKTLQDKDQTAKEHSIIDYGLYAAINQENLTTIPLLSTKAAGFKIFLGSSTNTVALPSSLLTQALKAIKNTPRRVLIHAEDERCIARHEGPEATLKDHNRRRPPACEAQAINNILLADVDTPTHICHLSSHEGIDALTEHPASISVGATPQHLLLDCTMDFPHPTWAKVNPPLRLPTDREALWNALTTGQIDVLESDHAPHTLEEKEADFSAAPSGMPGVETMYPLFLALVKHQRISLSRVLTLLCERPAQLAGISKGSLEVGRDADFIVVDLKQTSTITADRLHSHCGWTAFEGHQAVFPLAVYLRGEQIIDGAELLASPGSGRNIIQTRPTLEEG